MLQKLLLHGHLPYVYNSALESVVWGFTVRLGQKNNSLTCARQYSSQRVAPHMIAEAKLR